MKGTKEGVQTLLAAIKAPGVTIMCSGGLEQTRLVQTPILLVSQWRGKTVPRGQISAACQSIQESIYLTQLRVIISPSSRQRAK